MIASIDASESLVLAAGSPLLANLAALWPVAPDLASELESLPDDAGYATETARNGEPTLACQTTDGRSIAVHSRHRPGDEGRRLIDALGIGKKPAYYVLGFGLGYHVESLWSQAGGETVLIVFEPDLRMLWTAFSCRDYSEMIASRRLMIFWRPDKAELIRRLSPLSAVLSLGPATVPHAPSLQLYSEFFAQVQIWLEEIASYIRTGMNTVVFNAAKTAENIAANVGWYAASPSVARLRDRYYGYPAVIVSAGPSLRKNKHLLAGLNDQAAIIAVQTTLQPLLEMGVEPHFVTSLDYHEICSRFFERLPSNLRTELVAEAKATEKIFELYPGPVTLLGNDYAEGLLREMNPSKPILTAGATVAHLAFYLAEFLGCNPIIFVGQDLGFSDGLCYSPGTSYEDVWRPEMSRFCTVEMKQWEQIVRERQILRRVPAINGGTVYTEERLFMYLQQFERDFAKSRATIIDATEGGALKRGATPMTLAEAIQLHCRRPLPLMPPDHAGLNWGIADQCAASLMRRRQEAEQIGRISRSTLPLLEEIRDYLDDQNRVNRLIARIDPLRAQMDEYGRTYDLVTQLTQKTELDRLERDLQVAASGVSGMEKQRLQVERDVINVRAMIDAAAMFEDLMDRTIQKLSMGRTNAMAA